MEQPTLSYCGNLVRKHDKERFLCALLAPVAEREKLFTILACNYEIARIREMVTEPMAGFIRLQWWRETIEKIYTGVTPHHEVAKPLAELIQAQPLSQGLWDAILDAREDDMEDTPPETLEKLLAYCERSVASVFIVMLEALGVHDQAYHHAAKHLGIAWALTGILRSLRFSANKRLMLPLDLLQAHDITPDDVQRGKKLEQVIPVIRTLADIVTAELKKAREVKFTRQVKPVFLIDTYIETYLKRIVKAEYDVFHTDMEGHLFWAQITLLWRFYS